MNCPGCGASRGRRHKGISKFIDSDSYNAFDFADMCPVAACAWEAHWNLERLTGKSNLGFYWVNWFTNTPEGIIEAALGRRK